MLNAKIWIVVVAFSAWAMAGCASRQPAVTAPKPVVKSIALVPATPPQNFSLYYSSSIPGLIGLLVQKETSKDQGRVFNEKILDPGFRLDQELTDSVAEGLRAKGYSVTVLKDVKRSSESPDSLEVDLEELGRSMDAVVHFYFYEVGVESPRRTNEYRPRLNVYVSTFVREDSSYPFRQYFYYGVDATAGAPNSIVHDPKHAYPDFDTLVNNIERVRSDLRVGATQVGQRVAEQVHHAFK